MGVYTKSQARASGVLDKSKAIWLGQNTAWGLILLTMELLGV